MLFISSFYFVLWLIDITAAGLLGYLAAITLEQTHIHSAYLISLREFYEVTCKTTNCSLCAKSTQYWNKTLCFKYIYQLFQLQCWLRFWIFIFFSQILDVNGQNFENVPLSKANEILKNNTHLSITVKTNLLGKLLWLKWPKLHRLSFRPNTKFQSALSPLQEGKM